MKTSTVLGIGSVALAFVGCERKPPTAVEKPLHDFLSLSGPVYRGHAVHHLPFLADALTKPETLEELSRAHQPFLAQGELHLTISGDAANVTAGRIGQADLLFYHYELDCGEFSLPVIAVGQPFSYDPLMSVCTFTLTNVQVTGVLYNASKTEDVPVLVTMGKFLPASAATKQ